MKCELCELQEICDLANVSSHTTITCEAFKDAVRKYGGKEKVLEEIYDLIKNAVLYKEEKQDVNEPFTYDRFLQSYPFGTISKRTNKDGFLLHPSHVPIE